jgi:hypothetical protein
MRRIGVILIIIAALAFIAMAMIPAVGESTTVWRFAIPVLLLIAGVGCIMQPTRPPPYF